MYKLPEVAQRLEVSLDTARRYVRSGEIPSVFVGGSYRISEEDLEKYLEDARVRPKGDLGKAPASPSEQSAGRRTTEGVFETLEDFVALSRKQAASIEDLVKVAYQTPLAAAVTVRNLFYETAASLDTEALDDLQRRRYEDMCESIEAVADDALRALDEGEALERQKDESVPNNVKHRAPADVTHLRKARQDKPRKEAS